MFVRSRHCGELNRGLQNLDVLCKENEFILFACTKRTKSTPEVCEPLDSGERFKALSKKISAKFSGNTSRTRFFAQNGGEKALNRCDVWVLQRKELKRTSKEEPYSLRTVGYGWAKKGGGQKRTAFSAYAKPTNKEKPFFSTAKFQFPTALKLTCSNPFQISLATVSLQQNNPFSKLRNLASDVRLPFRTDSNPHRRYPGRLSCPSRPVT